MRRSERSQSDPLAQGEVGLAIEIENEPSVPKPSRQSALGAPATGLWLCRVER